MATPATPAAVDLQRLFSPRSIAVVGASATSGKIGAVPLGYLSQLGFKGMIYPVNPGSAEIAGHHCYARLSEIGAPVDMAIFAVPAARIDETIDDAVAAGVGSAVLFTSGFAETGSAGAALQARLTDKARACGMRVLGPNCLGYINVRKNIYATFSPAPGAGVAAPGSISIVSQSGAFGAYAFSLARNRGLGLSYWITTGNQADVDVSDCIEFLIQDAATRVIMLYMEGAANGAKLRLALERARDCGKPVVVTKVGRTSAGARAAMSHTAALAGDDAAYQALFRQCGAIRAHSIEDFFNFGYALSMCPARPAHKSLGVITISGGVGALIADDAETLGIAMPSLSQASQDKILAMVPFASALNPVDITGQATAEPILLERTADLMMQDVPFGSVLVFLAAAGSSQALWPHFAAFAQGFRARHATTPLVLCALFSAERRADLESYGALVFDDPSAAVRTMAAISAAPARTPQAPVARTPALELPAGPLTEAEALAKLAACGIAVVPHAIANSREQARAIARQLGYPVVLKISSAEILHKSDIGAVRLNLRCDAEVDQAYDQIVAAVSNNAPHVRPEGMLVAAMKQGGIECIVGVKRDASLGALVMFGLGGVDVELYRDVSFRLAPFDQGEALRMIDEVRASALLRGYRGRSHADVGALVQVLVRLSEVAAASSQLASIDINPLTVMPQGQGVFALDALLVGQAGESSQNPSA